MNSEAKIQTLEAENAMLRQQLQQLEEKVIFLLQQIELQAVKKDSHNSHNPPSQDKYKPKRNQSLRKKTGRKSGGQKGHKGHQHKQNPNPDRKINLKSNYCESCGNDLSELSHTLLSKRQVIELPPINPICIEYRRYGCICLCGYHQKASYPSTVTAPIQFGSDIMALVSYFNVFQYIPYARLKLLFKDVFNLSISEGSIENLLNKGAEKSKPVYQTILEKIKSASYLGADETGAKVNGEKLWI